jgi:hypothetical protein
MTDLTDDDRALGVACLRRPVGYWRQLMPKLGRSQRMGLFHRYHELADKIARLPGGLNDERRRLRAALEAFAWVMNDTAVDYHDRTRRRRTGKVPPYGAELAAARRRNKVPVPVNDVHVAIALRHGYRITAQRTCLLVEPVKASESYDFRFLAGLAVEIHATASDVWFADRLVRILAADGVDRVTLRRLDRNVPIELLYDGGKPWRP